MNVSAGAALLAATHEDQGHAGNMKQGCPSKARRRKKFQVLVIDEKGATVGCFVTHAEDCAQAARAAGNVAGAAVLVRGLRDQLDVGVAASRVGEH